MVKIMREVSMGEETRPGDLVTLTGLLMHVADPCSGLYIDLGGRMCLYDEDTCHEVDVVKAGLDYKIEREVELTTAEPRGLGAVVRRPDGLAFVRYGNRWTSEVGTHGYPWCEVVGPHDGVEVLSEGVEL